jgi:hypothetical protein
MAGQNSEIPVIRDATPLSTRNAAVPALSSRVSAAYPAVIPAGQTISLNAPGTNFYVVTATANLSIRPENGVFSTYSQGTGENCDRFSYVEIRNDTAQSIVCLIFIGWENFIDNRLILNAATTPNVANPTYPLPNVSSTVNIPDLSGGSFTDINGKKWLATSRVCILVFNLDAGTTYLLQKADATTANGVAVGAIYPVTPIRFEFSGNYRITTGSGGANINAIVSEVYQAFPA